MTADAAKIASIRKHFASLLGNPIVRYQTAELLLDDGTWDSWADLPVRIYTDSQTMVAVSWSEFDNLWLGNDDSLPFAPEDATTRWVENGIPSINGCLGRTICGVSLGRGQLSIGGDDIEIWTRLVIDLNDQWLEIYNALDENGYELHTTKPAAEFVRCV